MESYCSTSRSGLSSNDALQRVKRLLGARKAGHGGNLDPLASGMLPICLGEATKLAGATARGAQVLRVRHPPGRGTATGDLEGEIVEERASTGAGSRCRGDRAGARSSGAPNRYRPCTRRSSTRVRGSTSSPGAASRLPARRASSTSKHSSCASWRRRASRCARSARKVPTCARWHRTSPGRSAPAGMSSSCAACGSSPSRRADGDSRELSAEEHNPEVLQRWLLPPDRGVEAWPRMDLDAEDDPTAPRRAICHCP